MRIALLLVPQGILAQSPAQRVAVVGTALSAGASRSATGCAGAGRACARRAGPITGKGPAIRDP